MVTPGEYQAELDLPITYDVNTEIEAIEVASDPTLQLDADDIASPLLDAESVSDAPQAHLMQIRLMYNNSYLGISSSINSSSSRSTKRK